MRSTISFLVLAASLTWTIEAGAQQLIGPRPLGRAPVPEPIPGQYIVELHPGAPADALLRAHGISPMERWDIIHGFVAHLPDATVASLLANPHAKSVKPDLVVHASIRFASAPNANPGGTVTAAATSCPDTSAATAVPQEVPTGVQRIGARNGASTGAGVR